MADKKTVVVIWDDIYHKEATYTDITKKLFDNDEWELTVTYSVRDLLKPGAAPALALHWTVGRNERTDEPGLTLDEQAHLQKLVENGMNSLYIHAGLACVQDGTPMYEIARGRFASHPKPHNPVTVTAIPGIEHPILNGFEPFEDPDEHYFCKIDIPRVTPFLASISIQGTEIAGWTHQLGKGRVCGLTPGHNAPMLNKMEKLLANAAAWCVGRL
ncbi:MAG: ThuA domain-containing protein [Oscillospiraceae bacterium]|jgi:type 1 glutamine amidotransferase|nr:ThuA domain-containing protein [Oscillospiraceae bacterium]